MTKTSNPAPVPVPDSPPAISDELLPRLREGDAAAYRELVDRLQDRVLNIAYRFVRDRQDAEDVAQEVFLEVYRSLPDFRGQAQLSTWIFSIGVRKSLDFLRRQKRKKRFGKVRQLLGLEDAEPELQAPPSTNPQICLEEAERARVLYAAVESLPTNQCTAITLNKYEGFSYTEVATIMGTSVSSVESLIHRAVVNLRKKLRNYYGQHLDP